MSDEHGDPVDPSAGTASTPTDRVATDVTSWEFTPVPDLLGDDDLVRPTPTPRTRTSRGGRSRVRGVLLRAAGLAAALAVLGGVSAGFAAASGASSPDLVPPTSSSDVAAGQALYQRQCITCHGANLQGVPGRGVSLVGVGEAAVVFQVGTGRMPLAQQDAEANRKPPLYDDRQVEQIAAYVQTFGGGPTIPAGDLRNSNNAEGGQLFRLNCAQCHGFSGHGGALSAGKYAPSLEPATDPQIYAAMLTGPENMPVFSDGQLTPDQKKSIITYVQDLKAQKDPGGSGIGRIGPVNEGIVIWVFGLGAIAALILWIGAKS